MTEYRTIEKEAAVEFTERRSHFIGFAKPVSCEQEATAFLNAVRAKHWDATHNVYAYSLREGQVRRYSDDGEPQGTAGIPTLDVILKSGVTDIVVVVTRYFGGVLLGAGGLVRAYSHGASLAVEAAGMITMRTCLTAEVACDYSQYGRLVSLIPESGGVIDDTAFTEEVTVSFHISDLDMEPFRRKLADLTCGQREAVVSGEKYFRIL